MKRSRRSARAAKPSASGTSRTRVAKRQSSLAPRTVVVGTLCVVAAAALIMSRQSSVINWQAEVDAAGNVHRLERVDSFDPAAADSPAPTPANNAVSPRSPRPASPTTALEPAAKHVEPAPAAYQFAPSPASTSEPQARLVPASLRTTESEPEPASPASPPGEQTAPAVPATIAGCLERNANTFWLKDVSGDDAPKSRSWRSGFLRKKAPSIELVDRGSSNRLAPYVGRKIETTGALVDHEMHVKTLRVLGACE